MNDRLVVSVVAPVFNEAAALPEFIRRLVDVSARLADRYDWEFILVDDGSTDASVEIARGLIAAEPRLRVIELRRNFGQTAALQAGLAAASGALVTSLGFCLQHFPANLPAFPART